MIFKVPLRSGSAAAIFASAVGPRICLAPPDEEGVAALLSRFDNHHGEVKAFIEASRQAASSADGRLMEIEQRMVRNEASRHRELTLGFMAGGGRPDAWGTAMVQSDQFKQFIADGKRGTARVQVKALTSGANSAGELITPDRQSEVIMLPQRRLTVRALLGFGRTESKSVEFVRQTGFTNNAAPVAEGVQKPESNITFTTMTAPVRTIAHWIPVSRQAMDDAAGLSSLIDAEMRYGLVFVEEQQLLLGNGTGENIHGLIPQATAFDDGLREVGDTMADTLLRAITQAELAELPATGVMLNTTDWARLMALKDGNGQYLGGGPFSSQERTIWDLPKAVTPAMPEGEFLVGAFGTAAQIFDRLDAEVLVSSEDRDNFIKNMLTVRAEERLALAVKRPEALIHGEFAAPPP